jgi:hypothetical protein
VMHVYNYVSATPAHSWKVAGSHVAKALCLLLLVIVSQFLSNPSEAE